MARILLLTNEFYPFCGGIGTYTFEIAKAAYSLGHNVTVLAPFYKGHNLIQIDRQFPFHIKRYCNKYGNFSYPVLLKNIFYYTNKNQYDIIHSCDLPFLEMLSIFHFLHKKKFTCAIHGSDVYREKLSIRGRAFKPFGVFDKPEFLYCNSFFTRKLLIEQFPKIDKRKVKVAYLGVDRDWFVPPVNHFDIRKYYGISKHERIITTVSRITPRKGQLIAMQAFNSLPKELQETTRYLCVGVSKPEDRFYLRRLSQEVERSKGRIIMTGYLTQDQIKNLYSESYIFCLPGCYDPKFIEGFGLVFIEAGAQHLPSIAGRIGAVPEIVRENINGILVEPGNIESLSQGLIQILENKKLRNRLAQNAYDQAKQYSWKSCAITTFGYSSFR